MPIAPPPSPPLGHLRHAVGRLEFHVGVQVADGSHRAAGVDGFLHFFGRRDRIDEEVDQLQAVLGEVVGHLGPGGGGHLFVAADQFEHAHVAACPSTSVRRETIRSLRKSVIASVVNLPCVPTSVSISR